MRLPAWWSDQPEANLYLTILLNGCLFCTSVSYVWCSHALVCEGLTRVNPKN